MVFAMAAVMLCTFSGTLLASSLKGRCEQYMIESATANGIPLGVLYAIGLTETGRANSLQPYALNIAGKAMYPASLQQALNLVKQATEGGEKMIDVGCMQINYFYHAKKFQSVEDMLDARQNVAYAAAYLKKLFRREGSWTLAAARYHAGPNNLVAQKRYVCAVITNLVASGFGRWTNVSRLFCS